MFLYKQRKNNIAKGNRLLISITFMGSAGPIRFVVNEEELVVAVIDTALQSYSRVGRYPVLGSNINDFLLYCPHAGSDGNNIYLWFNCNSNFDLVVPNSFFIWNWILIIW